MLMRLVHRLCHFVLYAVLFLTKMLSYKLQRMRNTARWACLMAVNRFDEDQILRRNCVTGGLLGSKKLTHAAVIVNELHKSDNRPTRDQVDKLSDVLMWLLLTMQENE